MVAGSFKRQYTQIYDFCNEIRRANPGSTTIIKTEPSIEGENVRTFQRVYISIRTVVDSFINTCRPLIGLDGYFLKGEYHGILLVAVGRDPNDQYFPIAVAVVESENQDSWEWFIEILLGDIGRNSKWVFISDQQKGLINVLDGLKDVVEQRTCVRHLYANLKKYFGGGTLIRDIMWAAANATYVEEWNRKLDLLKKVKPEAYDWLVKTDPKLWTKAHFSVWSNSDIVTNNITEAFNGRLLEARELPIISMLNWIRVYLMVRFAKNRLLCEKYKGKGTICPRPRKRLDRNVDESGKWEAIWSGHGKYQVSKLQEQFCVDLEKKHCTCRLWSLSGIPCEHAVSAIRDQGGEPYDFIDPCFRIEKYEECYAPVINPINGENLWSKVEGAPTVLPPICRTPIGRPKKLRRREKDEPRKLYSQHKLKRRNSSLTCSKCGTYGHNKRSCTRRPSASQGASSSYPTPAQEISHGPSVTPPQAHGSTPSTTASAASSTGFQFVPTPRVPLRGTAPPGFQHLLPRTGASTPPRQETSGAQLKNIGRKKLGIRRFLK